MPKTRPARLLAASLLIALPAVAHADADIVLSSNDGHSVMDAQMTIVAAKPPAPDTVSLIEVGRYPPVVKATIEVPGSVVGPPMAAWIAKDASWAIVTSATKADAQAKTGISPDDRVSVIDLTSNPPKIAQSLTSGLGATEVRVSPDGGLALIANRAEGTVSVFTVKDKRLTAVGKVDTGNKASLPSSIAFVDDKTGAADPRRRQPGERAAYRRHRRHHRSSPHHHRHGALHHGHQCRPHAGRGFQHGPRRRRYRHGAA